MTHIPQADKTRLTVFLLPSVAVAKPGISAAFASLRTEGAVRARGHHLARLVRDHDGRVEVVLVQVKDPTGVLLAQVRHPFAVHQHISVLVNSPALLFYLHVRPEIVDP